MWRPETKALKNIRELIDEAPSAWNKVKTNKALNAEFEFVGDSLVNAPRGYAKDHTNLEDLKRKDFMVVSSLKEDDLYRKDLAKFIATKYKKTVPLMRFLCEAQQVNF